MLFIETSTFTRELPRHLDYASYAALQAFLCAHPDVGDVVPDTGGVREVHWASHERSPGTGARVIYHWPPAGDRIHMLTLYREGTNNHPAPGARHAWRTILEELDND